MPTDEWRSSRPQDGYFASTSNYHSAETPQLR